MLSCCPAPQHILGTEMQSRSEVYGGEAPTPSSLMASQPHPTQPLSLWDKTGAGSSRTCTCTSDKKLFQVCSYLNQIYVGGKSAKHGLLQTLRLNINPLYVKDRVTKTTTLMYRYLSLFVSFKLSISLGRVEGGVLRADGGTLYVTFAEHEVIEQGTEKDVVLCNAQEYCLTNLVQ